MFKKDRITKLIEKEKNDLYNYSKNNEIDLLELHFKMENKISKLYDKNQFRYQDLLDRKRHITSFRENTKNVGVSLLFGMLGSAICSFAMDFNKILSDFNVGVSFFLAWFILLTIAYFIIKTVLKAAAILSDNDYYNVDLYELEIIENKLQEYENKKQI